MIGTGEVGRAMYALVERLYPICRSLTGDGVRETLRILAGLVPLEIHEVASGTQVFDWVVPDEWNVRDAWIARVNGERVVDFLTSNLHVVGYSTPIRKRVTLEELRGHLHTLDGHPDWIPYRTSYYERNWGFCVSRRQYEALVEPEYDVCIDATLGPGSLTYGELAIRGGTEREFVFTTHVCHPSMCNDNLSGIAVATFLARALAQEPRRWSYRFLFIPGTIGSLAWMAGNREILDSIQGGMSLVCLGDASPLTYKRSLAGTSLVDRAAAHVLRHRQRGEIVIDYVPFGYDERQFNAPGFRIPVGSLMRARHGTFPEYHTSADDLSFVSGGQLADALDACLEIVEVLEGDLTYVNQSPYGEPQLGRRGVYRSLGGEPGLGDLTMAMLWVLALSDGSRSLLDIADRAGVPFRAVKRAADALAGVGLVRPGNNGNRP
ncbi:MAG: DUF4910 domain-containing protein [Armatimonadota bacterium]|nr:DUF4910 domain-containing protein [Armatimonadota bacterium]